MRVKQHFLLENMSTMWQKFELLAQQEWMISLDTNNPLTKIEKIAPEIEMIKKLAACDSNDTKIYFKFNKWIQNKIQCAIEDGFEDHNDWDCYYPHPSAPSLIDLSVDGICCDFFGIEFDAQLMIWHELNGKGTLRVWNTTPTMINDTKVMIFPACTVLPPPSTDIKIIEDTQELLTKTCIPNGKLLGHGYCRKHTENKIIPDALIGMIIRYFNVDLKTLDKYWISKE